MNKVVRYLNQHVLGEVTVNSAVLASMSRDKSVLTLKPDVVFYPRSTSDIRKVARFASQMAERQHILALTPRGGGTDTTGAALGKGVILSLASHMNKICEFDPKQKQVRLQPGVTNHTLNQALRLQGQAVPVLPSDDVRGTVGGALASGVNGPHAGRLGSIVDWVERLEVVLASGDVIQTGRLSKRELSKKRALTTPEGELYRELDNLIDDNKALIEAELSAGMSHNAGYRALADVKRRDGSFDLTPLFIGSQGTLGIIAEMIVKTEFVNPRQVAAALVFQSAEAARDTFAELRKIDAAFVEYYDGALFDLAAEQGVAYPAYTQASETGAVGAIVYVQFDDFSERARTKKLKRLTKLAEKSGATIVTADQSAVSDLSALRGVISYSAAADKQDVALPILDGFSVPDTHSEAFLAELAELATSLHVTLPVMIRVIDNIYYVNPLLQLSKVGDKQKVFKLLSKVTELIAKHDGQLVVDGAEGRLKAPFVYNQYSPEVQTLFVAVKNIFDPAHILNPGVKEPTQLKSLVAMLRSEYVPISGIDELPGSHG